MNEQMKIEDIFLATVPAEDPAEAEIPEPETAPRRRGPLRPVPGDRVWTAIFGEVDVMEVFETEEAARAAGYYFDGHAYLIGEFGGVEVAPYKVLARDNCCSYSDMCGGMGEKNELP